MRVPRCAQSSGSGAGAPAVEQRALRAHSAPERLHHDVVTAQGEPTLVAHAAMLKLPDAMLKLPDEVQGAEQTYDFPIGNHPRGE